MNETLSYYNNIAYEYANETKSADISNLADTFLEYLDEGTSILDLGCGSGRDSKYFIERGFDVTALDGSKELSKIASEFIRQNVLCMRFEEIEFVDKFDGIWACASILHLPYDELPDVLRRISRALKVGGYFFTSFKYGTFEGVRNGRYFTDMTEKRFQDLIRDSGELKIVDMYITQDVRENRQDEKWLNAVIKKG